LLGKRFDFLLRIKNLALPNEKYTGLKVDYKLGYGDKAEYFKT